MASECFHRNPKLVVSDLGVAGFVVFVPPEPAPLRFPTSAWLLIDALGEAEMTQEQLRDYLRDIPPDHETVDQYLDWLLNKRIFLFAEALPDAASTPAAGLSGRPSSPQIQSYAEIGGVDESNGTRLFTLNPDWPASVRAVLLRLLSLQIWIAAPMLLVVVAYLAYCLLTPAPSPINLQPGSTVVPAKLDVLEQILIGLLTVNLLSTAFTWLAQSITGLGDGKIVLRLLFGFIPRLGVNPCKLPTKPLQRWTHESRMLLLCVAQPLLTRLGLASALIVLLASSRLHSGLAGAQWFTLASTVLQICLITGLILALPFRMSPGYRLLILLTGLPSNTLGQSIRHLYAVLLTLVGWLRYRDPPSWHAFKGSVSSRRDQSKIAFALISVALILGNFLLVLLLLIPRLASGVPPVLGGASELIFTLFLLALLLGFLSSSILPKLAKLSKQRSQAVVLQTEKLPLQPPSSSRSSFTGPRSRQTMQVVVLMAGLMLFFPIDRTVTGSVLVSTERDLTVRAPADVRIIKIFQRGPSIRVIATGQPLIQLQSQELDHDLYQSNSEVLQLRNDLSSLKEKYKADLKVLREIRESLNLSQQAGKVLDDQLQVLQSLTREGAYSQKLTQDVLLQSFALQGEERLKLQRVLELQAELATAEIKINAIKQALDQSIAWQKSLLQDQRLMAVTMPFDGLITSSTSGLMGSFVSKGESLLELKEGSLNVVDVLIPDHDRALVKSGQRAEVRLYAEQNESLAAVVQSIRPTGELVDDKVFFQASLRLSKPLSPQLLESSGAARINTGKTNLLMAVLNSIGRFIRVDLWSWTP